MDKFSYLMRHDITPYLIIDIAVIKYSIKMKKKYINN